MLCFYIDYHMRNHDQCTPGILEMLLVFNGRPTMDMLARRRWLRRECDSDNIIGDDRLCPSVSVYFTYSPWFCLFLFILHILHDSAFIVSISQFDVRAVVAATQKGPNGCSGTFCQPDPSATKQQQQKLLLGVNDISTATALNIRANWFTVNANGMPGGNKRVGLF